MADSRPKPPGDGGRCFKKQKQKIKGSSAAQGVMFHAVLQAIEVRKTLLPALVTGLDIDMPGTRQNPRLGAPITGQLHGAGCADGAVFVGTDDLARERQQ